MRVKIAQVVGIVFLILFGSGCTSTVHKPTSSDVRLSWWNNLDSNEKRANYEAVMFALDTLGPGEEMRWDEGNAFGYVKVFTGYQHGDGFCKMLSVHIERKGDSKSINETACRSFTGNKTWRFVN